MTLNDVLAKIAPTGAQISGREDDPDGDGYILWLGRPNELVFPSAVGHCIPIHVDRYDNPELHDEETEAILRRFLPTKKSQGKVR